MTNAQMLALIARMMRTLVRAQLAQSLAIKRIHDSLMSETAYGFHIQDLKDSISELHGLSEELKGE